MQLDHHFEEELPRIAAENFKLANRLCESCGQMHALWSYIRLARASPGAEPTSSKLECILSELIAGGCRKVLIAGSQDTGLLALVARAGSNICLEIVVLDRCATPLEACQRLARSWSLPIKTVRVDLMNLDMYEDFDLVLLHFTLHYIPTDRQLDVLGRLRRALRSTGRLLLLFNVGQAIAGELVSEHRDGYADWVLNELERLAVPLPESREAFHARLRSHAQKRERREGTFSDPKQVHELLASAGYTVWDSLETPVTVIEPLQRFLSKIHKRRFLVVAHPQ